MGGTGTKMDETGILEAARAVRPYLSELVGPAAGQLDTRIAALLNESATGAADPDALRVLLDAEAATRIFLQAVLDDAPYFRPPEVQFDVRRTGYQKPPGKMNTVLHLGKYICPGGDYVLVPALRIGCGPAVPDPWPRPKARSRPGLMC